MIIKSAEEIIVFESPDGGKTIFSRKSGEVNRTLHHKDASLIEEEKENQRWLIWRDILCYAKSNSALNDVVHQAEMVYNLIREEKK